MSAPVLVGAVVIIVVAVVIGLALRGRTSDDGVASFQRQIDALSPEARRPTVDQVRSVDPAPLDSDTGPDTGTERGTDTDDAEGT